MHEPAYSPARHVVAIGSGKGGVGKSTVTLNVAIALAQSGARTGILDADIHGPDIPLLVNLARREHAKSWTLWRAGTHRIEPIERFGVKIMSTGFVLGEDQPLALEANLASVMLSQFLRDVDWGPLDYLLVDLPPGTADVQQSFFRLTTLSGAIVVVTPQDVAHLDARKAVQMYRQNGVRVLGGIENMAGLVCPHCAGHVEVFHGVRPDRAIWTMGVAELGRIPLDPGLSRAGDTGHPLVASMPDSPQAAAFRAVARRLVEELD